jgi:hypothetical protein
MMTRATNDAMNIINQRIVDSFGDVQATPEKRKVAQ